jgi:succinyl-CoA synthetase beta subunit
MDLQAVRGCIAQARLEKRSALSEAEAKRVLAACGIAVPRSRILPPDVAGPFADGMSPPFVAKVIARDLLHKTEVGGVRLNLGDEQEAAASIGEMRNRIASSGHRIDGWLLEEMAPPGVEVVVGGLRDRRFGPVVMCGLGGILVELLEDVAFGICPVDPADCREMVAALRGAALLQGWRGAAPAALAALYDVLLRVGGKGGLMDAVGDELAELDINPLIVSPTGAVAVDARIVLVAQ